MKSIALTMSIFLAGTAAAEPGDRTFDSLTMGRLTPITTFSLEFGFEVWDEGAFTDIDVYTINLAGHFVGRRGVGGYFVLPMTYLDVSSPLFEDSELAIGNIEAGALIAKQFGRTAIVFHGGVGLPTAQDEGAAAFQFFGSFTRIHDVPLHVTNSTWLRMGLSPMGRARNLFWRADIGLDLALDEDNAVELSPVFHLGVGGGVDLGSVQLLGEFMNVFADPEDDSDDTASTFAFGARFTSGDLRPGVGILLPLDFDFAPDFEWALLASLAFRVP